MLENTPMLIKEHSNAARACQSAVVPVDGSRAQKVIAAVAWAYSEEHLEAAVEVTPAAILGTGRQSDVAWARHVCAYLLAEDYHLTNLATARALRRSDHSMTINSRARIATALAVDAALAATLTHARAILAGTASVSPTRCRRSRPSTFAGATPAELAEYRYWRLRALRTETSQSDAPRGAAMGYGVHS